MIIAEMDEREFDALGEIVNSVKSDYILVADVGTYVGGSSQAMARALVDAGKAFLIVAVDPLPDTKTRNKYFRNMKHLIAGGVLCPMITTSEIASYVMQAQMFDIVYIDADHSYTSVMQDIGYWSPKVKNGGYLCGHDCDGYYSKYTPEQKADIDNHLEDEGTSFECHPGVVKALWDCFKDRYTILDGTRIWMVGIKQ